MTCVKNEVPLEIKNVDKCKLNYKLLLQDRPKVCESSNRKPITLLSYLDLMFNKTPSSWYLSSSYILFHETHRHGCSARRDNRTPSTDKSQEQDEKLPWRLHYPHVSHCSIIWWLLFRYFEIAFYVLTINSLTVIDWLWQRKAQNPAVYTWSEQDGLPAWRLFWERIPSFSGGQCQCPLICGKTLFKKMLIL